MIKKITILIITILIITIGAYAIFNNQEQISPEYTHGIQPKNINFTQNQENYQIQITLSPEQIQKGVTQINIEFYGEKSILYRDSIKEINGNTVTYELPKDIIREKLDSILITSFNSTGNDIGTTYQEI